MSELVLGIRRAGGAMSAVQRVWLFNGAVLLVLAALAPDQARETARFTLVSLADVAPWLVLSVGLAAYAAASGADNLIAKAFQGRQAVMIVSAALFGGLSPFCSCGVVPLIAALLAMGVPLAPVMAFWLASPVVDPAMFALTAGTLGFDFAVGKAAAAVGIGLLGGFGTLALSRQQWLADPLRPGIGNGGCGGVRVRDPKPPVWRVWANPARRTKFAREGAKTALFLLKWLTLAFILESLMIAYVPSGWVTGVVGGDGPVSVALATLVGVPLYLNGYAALPVVSGFMEQGMAPGAAMAFLVAGGVSCIPAAVAVWALAKPRVFALYLGFAFVGSLMAGLLFGAAMRL